MFGDLSSYCYQSMSTKKIAPYSLENFLKLGEDSKKQFQLKILKELELTLSKEKNHEKKAQIIEDKAGINEFKSLEQMIEVAWLIKEIYDNGGDQGLLIRTLDLFALNVEDGYLNVIPIEVIKVIENISNRNVNLRKFQINPRLEETVYRFLSDSAIKIYNRLGRIGYIPEKFPKNIKDLIGKIKSDNIPAMSTALISLCEIAKKPENLKLLMDLNWPFELNLILFKISEMKFIGLGSLGIACQYCITENTLKCIEASLD